MGASPNETLADSGVDSKGVAQGSQSWDAHDWSAGDRPQPQRGESFGRYVLLHQIGKGGMGVVYAAYDPELDRRVALKVLAESADDPTSQARLQREAQTMARLSHPNVITVHDVGTVGDRLFIAMELVDGPDLKTWLADGEHPWTEVLDALQQAGRGLAAAHDEGLIHRDFKPANVLVGSDGLVRVLDFGLARRVGVPVEQPSSQEDLSKVSNSHTESLTRTGAVAGTPAYMSPEQHARGDLDGKSDQFSFAVTAFEALFGERPFGGSGRLALMLAANSSERRPIPKASPVPSKISSALLRALGPKPEDRWPDMHTLLEQLHVDPSNRTRRWAIAGLAVVAAGAAGVASSSSQAPCRGIDDLRADVFSSVDRASIERSFAASKLPYASDALEHAMGELDGYLDGWIEGRRDACEATHLRGDQSEALLDRRVACLQGHRHDFEAIVNLLAEADDGVIERADAIVGSLETIDPCNDIETLSTAYPPPTLEQRDAVDLAEATYARGRALNVAHREDQALRMLERALSETEAAQYPPLRGRVLIELGIARLRAQGHEAASTTFHDAAFLALEVGDVELQIDAWIQLANVTAFRESRHDDALRWLQYAAASLPRASNRVHLSADIGLTKAGILAELGKLDEALIELDRVAELRDTDPSLDELSSRANVYIWTARYDLAQEALEQALEIRARSGGVDHPSAGWIYNGMGNVAFARGDLEHAEAMFLKAYEVHLHGLSKDNPEHVFSIGNVAEIRRMRGEYDKALEAFALVEAAVEKAYPAVHREVGTTNHNIASVYREMGEPALALARYDVAIEVRRAVHGDTHYYVANSLTGKALALLALDRGHEALPLLEDAMSIREVSESPPRKAARTEFGLARALAATDGDMPRAIELARSARARLDEQRDANEAIDKRVQTIDAWLSEHDGDAPSDPAPP